MLRLYECSKNSVIIELLWRCHAHSKLSFPLLCLQLQRFHSIAQSILPLLQLLVPQFLLRAHSLPSCTSLRSTTAWPCVRRARTVTSQSAVIEVALCNERLLPSFEFVKIVLNPLQKVVDLWPYF
jgi:hypothetical protein